MPVKYKYGGVSIMDDDAVDYMHVTIMSPMQDAITRTEMSPEGAFSTL